MGHGIAEVCALAGIDVYLKDIKQEFLDTAVAHIRTSLDVFTRKGRVKAGDVPSILSRIHPCLEYGAISPEVGLAIEAVPEIMALKKKVFADLDKILPKSAIIATNTSNLSITELASATSRSGSVVGMHFFNPPVLMDTVEIIKAKTTTVETFDLARFFVSKIGKLPIPILKDTPGFVVNRVQAPAQVLLGKIVEHGVATPEQVDALARKVLPMGPFETMDYVGLDIVKHGMDYFAEKLGKEYATPRWIEDLVAAKHLGKKTGKGIFDWSSGRPQIDLSNPTDKFTMLDLIVVQINEATKIVAEGIVEDAAYIDVAIANGTGNKMGIFGMLSDRQVVIDRLTHLADTLHIEMFRPTAMLSTMPVPNMRKASKRLRQEYLELQGR